MATGLAVLVTCLYTACGGGNGSNVADPSSLANAGTSAGTGVVSAAGNAPATAGGAGADTGMVSAVGNVPPAAGGDIIPPVAAGDGGYPDIVTAAVGPGVGTVAGASASTVMALSVSVDISKIPPAGAGTSTFNVAPTDEAAPLNGKDGAFRTVCTFAHMSFDDPIVFPGQPGRSHLHTFFGNTGADANSTPESLRNTGNSTCRGGIANRSSYWVPTLIDTKDNTPLQPDEINVYYKNGVLPAPQVQPMPTGLRMIAGDPTASAAHPEVFSMRWKCIGGPNKENDLYQSSIGNCDVGAQLYQEVFFPQCWDGINLDSPDHKSHMSYTVSVLNQNDPRGWSHAECPKTHPVVLPQVAYNVVYMVREKDAPLRWRLSSDAYDRSKPGGFSSHGDWFNGWKSEISDAWARGCIEAQKDCHSHLLGDGRKIF